MSTGRLSPTVGLLALAALAAAICLGRVLIGPAADGTISLAWPEPAYASFRWTSMLVGVTVGTSLAISGVLLQALLRNPLASPFILGVSSGAGLGVMVTRYVEHVTGATWPLPGGDMLPALVGGAAALIVVYLLGRRRGWLDPVTLVLVGVIISTICGALIMFFQHLVPMGLRGDLITWMMGHISEVTPPAVLAVNGGLAVVGLGLGLLLGRAMDAATLADDEARSVGVNLGPLRLAMFALAGVLTAAAVALAGPIGFVGLVAPHAARLLLGPQHTPLVVGAALCGVVFVVGADVGRQAMDFGAGRMPVGIFTALVGGPAFLWLLCSGRGQA